MYELRSFDHLGSLFLHVVHDTKLRKSTQTMEITLPDNTPLFQPTLFPNSETLIFKREKGITKGTYYHLRMIRKLEIILRSMIMRPGPQFWCKFQKLKAEG